MVEEQYCSYQSTKKFWERLPGKFHFFFTPPTDNHNTIANFKDNWHEHSIENTIYSIVHSSMPKRGGYYSLTFDPLQKWRAKPDGNYLNFMTVFVIFNAKILTLQPSRSCYKSANFMEFVSQIICWEMFRIINADARYSIPGLVFQCE